MLWEGFIRDSQQEDGTIDFQLLSSLEQSLKYLFIIEPFYTCCVVHSPWELNLLEITSKSGYLHSCGPLIYHNVLVQAKLD